MSTHHLIILTLGIINYLVPIKSEEIASATPEPLATPAPGTAGAGNSEGRCGFTYVDPSVDLTAIKSRRSKTRIVAGTPAEPHSYPWMVSLQYNGTNHFCGGAMIRVSNREESDIVLTASHCFEEKPPDMYAMVGANYLSECGEGCDFHVEVEKYVMHPEFNNMFPVTENTSTVINDIALVKLKKPLPFNEKIQPICLPLQGEQPKPGEPAIVAGWGLEHENLTQVSDELNQVAVPVMTDKVCEGDYQDFIILKYHFCAGFARGVFDACQGDSGGPLMFNTTRGWTARGIVSFGEGCARQNAPGAYTRVSNYVDWVDKTARALTSVPQE